MKGTSVYKLMRENTNCFFVFLKIGQNDSAHELTRMLQACSKFNFIYLFIFYFDDLHLQIIESISPKAYVEN